MTPAAPIATRLPVRPDAVSRRRIATGITTVVAITIVLALGSLANRGPIVAIGFALAGLAAVLAMIRPDTATYIVAGVLYSNAAAVAVNQHGLPYFVAIAFPLPLILPLAYFVIIKRQPVVQTPALPFAFLFLIVQLIGAVVSRDVGTAAAQIQVYLISGIGLYFIVTNVVRDRPTLRNVVWVVVLVGGSLGAVSTAQTVSGDFSNDFLGFGQVNWPGRGTTGPTVATAGIAPRATGPIGEVNRYAQIMLVLLPIGGMLAISERRGWRKALAAALTLLILLGMGSTFSRGAALGFTVIVLGLVAFRYLRPQHLLVVALGVAVVLTAFPRYGERLLNLQALTRLDRSQGGAPVEGDAGNLRGRATESLAALFAFADHPIVGVGTGLFPTYYQEYAREVSAAAIDTRIDIGSREAHNLYAQILAETGILGFICFMGVLLVTLRELIRARRRWLNVRPQDADLATGMALAVLGYMASGMTLHLSYERYFWFLLALAGSTAWVLRQTSPDDGETAQDAGTGSDTQAARGTAPTNGRANLRPSQAGH